MARVLAVMMAAGAIAWVIQGPLLVLASLLVVYVVHNWRWFYVAARTIKRDAWAFKQYFKIHSLSNKFAKENLAISDIFHNLVLKHPSKSCLLLDDEVWTFQQVEEFSLRVSAVLRSKGVKSGDVVGLMMSNCPEFPATWLGVTRLGAVVPLINTNQTGNALKHSINVAKCNFVIYEDEYEGAFEEIKDDLDPLIKLFKYIHRPLNTSNNGILSESADDFTSMLESTPPPPWFKSEGDGFNGKILYIYTSGTTGLPKAAVISSSRYTFMSTGQYFMAGLTCDDVIYCPMPLYHSAGGCTTLGQALIMGCTVALRKKFSASSYFKDCIKYNATVAHYIGEMCRYLLATPPSPTDTQHKVRLAYGNGMRPVIWPEFVKRFNIKQVAELYGATEGNANIGKPIPNTEGRAGMCGILDQDNSLDLDQLIKDISKDLPKYARPVFVRKMASFDMTGTFKLRKVDLQKEGFDPTKVSDKLYYLDPNSNKYMPLGIEEYGGSPRAPRALVVKTALRGVSSKR